MALTNYRNGLGKRENPVLLKKLRKEAGVNRSEVGTIAQGRKKWKEILRKRKAHLKNWERQQAHNHRISETVEGKL